MMILVNRIELNILGEFMLKVYNSKLQAFKSIYVCWAIICIALLVWTIINLPSDNERVLYSDQAVHISMALSIWHDMDLEYTLKDLERFREVMPAEPGPRGVFLKKGLDEKIYFAKPFLYALAASPFVAIFSLTGFTILNAILLFLIGLIALRIFQPLFQPLHSLALVTGLLVFSPFVAWLPVAHPDIFIAALLCFGGYLLINYDYGKTLNLLGAFILGLAIFEKPTFIVIIPFILFVLFTDNSNKNRKGLTLWITCLFLLIVLGWVLPTTINYFQDGSFLSYQGIRFHVGSAPFPLEVGWVMPGSPDSDHIFSLSGIANALLSNVLILPGKVGEFLVGRATGILVYYPAALFLLILTLVKSNIRSIALIVSFFAYLVLYWLIFPTNGYGGAGTYGNRYLLQAIPLVILALYYVNPASEYIKKTMETWVKSAAIVALAAALVLQHQVLINLNLVHNPYLFLSTEKARIFPLEKYLLPCIKPTMPRGFSESDFDMNTNLYRTGFDPQYNYLLNYSNNPVKGEVVLFQFGEKTEVVELSIYNSAPAKLTILSGGTVINELELTNTGYNQFRIDSSIFGRDFFDLLYNSEIRWAELDIKVETIDDGKKVSKGILDISLINSQQVFFTEYAEPIVHNDFGNNNVYLKFDWSYEEDWGIWTDGNYALVIIKPDPIIMKPLQFEFDVGAYTPDESPERIVNVFVNGFEKDVWAFHNQHEPPDTKFIVQPNEWFNSEYIQILFEIAEPLSPLELGHSIDPRKLGLGLKSLKVDILD